MSEATKRRLVAHEKLLIDVIKRQAGSLKKAILEGTMNSIEAGATKIDINFAAEKSEDKENPNKAHLSIYDDGIGIQTEKELIQHFETFGQPHEDNENVIWKQFRMGRGQMFAFGKNTWKTATFEMLVDIDNMELDYLLKKNRPYVDGCLIDIELYQNPLDNYTINSVKALKEEVQEQVRFVTTPVFFNGQQVSVDPETLNWTYQDEDAFYLFDDTSSLKIYNLGVYVMSIPLTRAGVGGVVVSKKRLDVNFARNDIQSTCSVYQRIKAVVEENKIKKVQKTYESMSNDMRINLLCDFRDGKYKYELTGKRIFPTSQGKWLTWNMIAKDCRPWCFARKGDRVADKVMQMGSAICFDEKILSELGYTGDKKEFFSWLWSGSRSDWIKETLDKLEKLYVEKDIRETINEDYKMIPPEKLRKSEKVFLQAMNALGCWHGRQIMIGKSTVAKAWTDGCTYIVFDREYIKNLYLHSNYGLVDLFTTGCHELAHDDSTAGTHVHGPEFYEKYYEITKNEYGDNPLLNIMEFSKKVERTKIEIKKLEEEKKEKKQKEKLGLDSSPIAATNK